MSEEEKILKTIRYCANDYMKQEDGIQCFEWGDLWVLNEYIDKLQQESNQLKEVIEEVRALHKKFCTKHGIIVFENNELIEFMNNLIDTLNKAKDNK